MKIHQSGFSLLSMVMILLIFAMLTLGTVQQRLFASLQPNNNEKRYIQSYNQALSALNWAMKQQWTEINSTWQCRDVPQGKFTACIKTAIADDIIILRGENMMDITEQKVFLYRRLEHRDNTPDNDKNLYPTTQGWFDLCPVKGELSC